MLAWGTFSASGLLSLLDLLVRGKAVTVETVLWLEALDLEALVLEALLFVLEALLFVLRKRNEVNWIRKSWVPG